MMLNCMVGDELELYMPTELPDGPLPTIVLFAIRGLDWASFLTADLPRMKKPSITVADVIGVAPETVVSPDSIRVW